jgi:riboflavin kinase/FMN adenylyltransferase
MKSLAKLALVRYPSEVPAELRGGIVTIGNFDGVHLGHEHLVKALALHGHGAPVSVVSFYPHPIQVLSGNKTEPRPITSIREKVERFADLGVSLLYLIHFTRELALMSARRFIEEILVKKLGAQILVVGEDVAIGRGREGNLAFLRDVLPAYGIELKVVSQLQLDGIRPSSRTIRRRLADGQIEQAQALLGRPYSISGRVCHGDKRGRDLGFPTANIALRGRHIPKRGVYACRVKVDGEYYKAVANIGVRPTFNGVGERLEVHIIDFPAASLYSKRILVHFLSFIRDEKKFASLEELKMQVAADREVAQMLVQLPEGDLGR